MKVYVGYKKEKGVKGIVMGVTVVAKDNQVMYSNYKRSDDVTVEDGKFGNYLYTLHWAIRQLKLQVQKGLLGDDDNLDLIIDNKTVYGWFEKNKTPETYAVVFSDILLDMRFLPCNLEVLFLHGCTKKVTYKRRGVVDGKGLVTVTDLIQKL